MTVMSKLPQLHHASSPGTAQPSQRRTRRHSRRKRRRMMSSGKRGGQLCARGALLIPGREAPIPFMPTPLSRLCSFLVAAGQIVEFRA